MPRQVMAVDRRLDSQLEALAERDHARERVLGQHLGEGCAHRGEGEDVRGKRAADPADVRLLPRDRRIDARGDVVREAVGRARDPAADRLADRQHVGLEPVRGRVPTRPRAERMGLVDDQERPVSPRRLSQQFVEPGLRRHDADVRECGLREDAGDIAVRELSFERFGVVPHDDPGRLGERNGRPDVRVAFDDSSRIVERREGLVDGAVVAPVEDQQLRPLGDMPREPDREPVRVRRRQRELPAGESEAARQLAAHDEGVLARQHERDAPRRLLGDRANRRLGRVAGHRPGVPEAEVDVLAPVDVAEPGTSSFAGGSGCPRVRASLRGELDRA